MKNRVKRNDTALWWHFIEALSLLAAMSCAGCFLSLRKVDYTIQGVEYRGDSGCLPARADVERWMDETRQCLGDDAQYKAGVKRIEVRFVCQTPAQLGAAGMSYPDIGQIIISGLDEHGSVVASRLAGLLAHELGHMIEYAQGTPYVVVQTAAEHHLHYPIVEGLEACVAARERR